MKKNLRLKAFLMMIICVLNCGVLCFSVTVAWFTTITQASSRSEGFTIKDSAFFSTSYRVFAYDKEYRTGIELLNDETNNPSDTPEDERLILDRYDSVITDNNANINKIIRLELVNKPGINFTSSSKFDLTITCIGEGQKDVTDPDTSETRTMMTDYISNLIGFKCVTRHELASIDETSADDIYTKVTAAVESKTETTFASITKNADNIDVFGGKEMSITLPNIDVDESNDRTIVYISYTYNKELIDVYIAEDEDNRTITVDNTEGNTVEFVSDVKTIAIMNVAV